MADLKTEVDALRLGVALSALDHVRPLRVSGASARELVDRLCPRELFVREGQMLHTLLLDDDARPVADAYVCRDDEAFVLLLEELPGWQADALLDRCRAGLADCAVEDLRPTHRMLSVNGPYAWELMSELVGPQIVGLPYLNFFHGEGWTCFRAGKTGEYGYDLLVPAARAPALEARLRELGARLQLGTARLEALDLCALENGFFNVRRDTSPGLTPIELQQQWRVSFRKAGFVGAEALARRKAEGAKGRATCIASASELRAGERLAFGGHDIGWVLSASYSLVREEWVGIGILELPFAHARIDRYTCGGDRRPVRTLASPVLENRSLFVSPQRDSYETRFDRPFPPLARRT